jgi:hypothetical protein
VSDASGVHLDHDFAAYNQKVLEFLAGEVAESRDVRVLLASRWMQYTGEAMLPLSNREMRVSLLPSPDVTCNDDCFFKELEITIQTLTRIGVHRILLWLPSVEFRYNVPRCLFLHSWDSSFCDMPRTTMESYRSRMVEALKKLAAKFPNVRWIDPLMALCDNSICSATRGTEPISFDDNHPSAAAAKVYGTRFASELDWLEGD